MMAQIVQGQALAREPPPDAARQLWPVPLNLDGDLNREEGVPVLAQDLDGHEPVRAVRQGRLDHLACRPEGVLASLVEAGEGQALVISDVFRAVMRVQVEVGHGGPSHAIQTAAARTAPTISRNHSQGSGRCHGGKSLSGLFQATVRTLAPGLLVGTEGLGPISNPNGSRVSTTYVAALLSSRQGSRGVPNVLGKGAERLPRHLDPLGSGVDDSPSELLQAGGVVGPVEGKAAEPSPAQDRDSAARVLDGLERRAAWQG